MAKTESTAVNELIDLVQNAGSTGGEPAGDLFDEHAAAPIRVQPPRMTTTVPAMRGAGEVAPLPPRRAPQSTATHQQVRMRTASPSRGTTIPPLPQPKARASVPPPIPSRTSSQQVVAAPPPIPPRTKSQEMAAPRTKSQEMAAPRTKSQEMAVPRTKSQEMAAARMTASPPAVTVPRTKSQEMAVPRTKSQEMAAPRVTASQPAVSPPPLPSRASSSSYVQGDVDVELDWDAETVAKSREEVTHSSPTLPSPRVTQPSFPALPQQSRPTLPMPRQSAPKLPPPRKTPRGSEPPLIGQPFLARSLMSDDPTPVTDERTPVTDERTPVTDERPRVALTAEKIDIDALVAKPETLPPPVAKARAKSEPPPPYTAKLTPLVFEPTAAVDFSSRIAKEDSTWVGRPSRSLARKLVMPAVAATLIGIGVGAYVATQSKKQPQASSQQFAPPSAPAVTMKESTPETGPPPPSTESPNAATAPSPLLAPEPPTKAEAAAPALAETQAVANAGDPAAEPSLTHDVPAVAPTPSPTPTPVVATLVDIRIDSHPPGATAVLVDDGKTLFLGTTPLATSLDPSRVHDIVVSYDGRATQMVHVDASKETRINVALKRVGSSRTARAQMPVATPAVAAAPKVEAPKAEAPKAATPKVEAPTTAAPKSAAPKVEAPKAPAPADATAKGTLMISSKPPCEIFIDGKPTGLTTPQRSIPLSVGTHKITLVNEAEGIKKTLPVTIGADKPTKLIQDLMQK